MSNMFKSERKPRELQQRNQNQQKYRYPSTIEFKEKKAPIIELKESDFPELIHVASYEDKNMTTNLNFKDATLKESDNTCVDDNLVPSGWVRYRYNNGNIIVDSNTPDDEPEEPLNFRANNIIGGMLRRWDTYKKDYDDLNGDGAYGQLYEMPFYESFLEDDMEYTYYDEY